MFCCAKETLISHVMSHDLTLKSHDLTMKSHDLTLKSHDLNEVT